MPNSYPARFTDLIQSGMTVLDNGAGARTYPGVITLEYEDRFQCDVRADGLDLPFRDDCFDLILSQAVLEHVIDPQRYIDEIFRVLRPGGILYLEVAFIQPVHCAPMHYYNHTPYAVSHVCRAFEIDDMGTIGTFQETIAWLCRSVGVKAPKVEEPKWEQRWHAASGIYVRARKP